MSDELLRTLERRYSETGSAEDEGAWLRALARSGKRLSWSQYERLHDLAVEAAADYLRSLVDAGELTPRQLDLLAQCGHEGAALLSDPPSATPFLEWLRGLRAASPDTASRVHLAIAIQCLRLWDTEIARCYGADDPISARPRHIVEVAEESLLEPDCPEKLGWLHRLTAPEDVDAWEWAHGVSHTAEWALNFIASLGQSDPEPDWTFFLPSALSEAQARAAVRAELVPWLLGSEDPVLLRSMRRAEEGVEYPWTL